ncbi:hypothetical protein ACTFIR_007642 [Dictyostelium discoideum]
MSTENDEIDDFFKEIENVGDSSKNTNNIITQTNSNSNSNSGGTAPSPATTSSANTAGIKRKLDDTPTTTTTTTTTTSNTTSTNVGVKPMIPPSLMKKKQMVSKTSINSNTPSKAVVSSKAVTYSANTINLLANDKPKVSVNYPTTTTTATNLSIAALRPQVTMEEPKKNSKIVMEAAGEKWTDHTLAEWDPNDFRIFVGDIGNDVTEEMLRQAFLKYPTFLKAKVVFDKVGKSRGFGFVSFSSSSDYISAFNTMNGKYIGNRPIKLRKSKWKDRLASNNK